MQQNVTVLPLHFVSYSSLNDFHACPRKFELRKMGGAAPEFKSLHFTYGHAVGTGIQTLLKTQEIDKAIVTAFAGWDMDLSAGIDENDSKKNHKKSFPYAIDAIRKFIPQYDVMSSDYELYYFPNDAGELVPALELSAKVILPNGFVYRIFIDAVVRHKETGELVVLELKTDGSKFVQEAKYANSNQALSYSVILDKIAPGNTSYYVWYFVYYVSLERWEFFPFPKSRLDKANWIRTVLYDTRNIQTCIEDDFFPKQGESCIDYGSPCTYYGACGMSNFAMYGGPETIRLRIQKEEAQNYNFTFQIQDIVDQQLEEIRA